MLRRPEEGVALTAAVSHGEGASAAAGPERASDGARNGFFLTLARRLAWWSVPAHGVASSDAMIIACAAAGIAVWLAFDRYAAGPDAYFYPGSVTGITWYAAGLLALAWVSHRASGRVVSFRTMLAAIVGGLPLLLALALGARTWAPDSIRVPAYALLGAAGIVYLSRSLGSAGASRRLSAMLATAGLALSFAWGTSQAFVDPHLWYAIDDDGESLPAETERLLFEQSERIDTAAAGLRAGEPDRPDVFFLGFAGVGEQKVFSEEIQLAERVVSERYGAAGRTVLLVNDRRDRETWPLATVHGLRRALTRMGERMDRAEDVLFLMLTSHGSEEPSLSVSNGTWPLDQLDAEALRSALDGSHIRWRVIVICACHSGAFIPPLANENTVIFTS
ncbi:MAG: C13 family peptidase, partial [Candidatus Rokuibacteriota bacterium]